MMGEAFQAIALISMGLLAFAATELAWRKVRALDVRSQAVNRRPRNPSTYF
jgi:hypothetical protein